VCGWVCVCGWVGGCGCVGVCGCVSVGVCDCVCVPKWKVRISAAVSCTQSLQGLSM